MTKVCVSYRLPYYYSPLVSSKSINNLGVTYFYIVNVRVTALLKHDRDSSLLSYTLLLPQIAQNSPDCS